LAVGSWQLAVGSWQLAVGSWQLAVGSWQLAVGSWQLAVKGKNRWGAACKLFCETKPLLQTDSCKLMTDFCCKLITKEINASRRFGCLEKSRASLHKNLQDDGWTKRLWIS